MHWCLTRPAPRVAQYEPFTARAGPPLPAAARRLSPAHEYDTKSLGDDGLPPTAPVAAPTKRLGFRQLGDDRGGRRAPRAGGQVRYDQPRRRGRRQNDCDGADDPWLSNAAKVSTVLDATSRS